MNASPKEPSRYEVVTTLSEFGGPTLLAAQKGVAGFRRLVTLREITPSSSEEQNRRYLEGITALAQLAEPRIAQVLDFYLDDGRLWVSTEFVPGLTLYQMAEECRATGKPLPEGLVIRLIREASTALARAADFVDLTGTPRSVAHPVLTPKAVVATPDGEARVLHIGRLAPEMSERSTLAEWLAPEQRKGSAADLKANLYNLGAILKWGLSLSPRPPGEEDPLLALAQRAMGGGTSPFATLEEFALDVEEIAFSRIWTNTQVREYVVGTFTPLLDKLYALCREALQREVTAVMPLSQIVGDASSAQADTQPRIRLDQLPSRSGPPVPWEDSEAPVMDVEPPTGTSMPFTGSERARATAGPDEITPPRGVQPLGARAIAQERPAAPTIDPLTAPLPDRTPEVPDLGEQSESRGRGRRFALGLFAFFVVGGAVAGFLMREHPVVSDVVERIRLGWESRLARLRETTLGEAAPAPEAPPEPPAEDVPTSAAAPDEAAQVPQSRPSPQ